MTSMYRVLRLPFSRPRSTEKNEPCLDPGHDPPSHMVFPPEGYEHVCPSCRQSTLCKGSQIRW
jgi:hypothetical protein